MGATSGKPPLGRRARRPAALLTVALAGLALSCGDDIDTGAAGPEPVPSPTPLLGRLYVLQTVEGAPPPVTLRQSGGRVDQLLADTLRFTAPSTTARTGRFVEVSIVETRDGAGAPAVTRVESEANARTFTRSGSAGITLSLHVATQGSVSGSLVSTAVGQPANLVLFVGSGAPWQYMAR